MTDKTNSLNEDKLDKLLFLKKNKNESAYLKRNEDKRIDQSKTKIVSITDDESILTIKAI